MRKFSSPFLLIKLSEYSQLNIFVALKMKLFLTIIIFLFLQSGRAQFDKFINYNVKDGLPSSEVYGVNQDSKGFIWIVGDAGISRFDGYKFNNYSTENGVADNTNFGIFEDNKHRIWFRSLSGRLTYFKNDSIFILPCNDSLSKIFRYIISNSFHVDSGDTIWIGAGSKFYTKILPGWKARDIQKIELPPGKYILQLNSKDIIFGGNHNGELNINVYNKNNRLLYSVVTGINNIKKEEQRFFALQLKNGNYLCSVSKNIYLLEGRKLLSKATEHSQIISMNEDTDGSLIVTSYNGASVFNLPSLKKTKTISRLRNKIVTGVCIDRENEAWYTTEGHGLYCSPYRNFSYYTTEAGLSDSKVSIARAFDSIIITGHLNGAIGILKRDTIVTVNSGRGFGTSQTMRVTGIISDKNKVIVTKVFGASFLYGDKLNEITPLEKTGFKRIIKTKAGKIAFIDFANLIICDPDDNFKILKFITAPSRADNIFEDSDGKIWVSAVDGVYLFNNDNFEYLGKKNPLFAYRPTDFCEGNDKSIWITTRGGGVIHTKGKSTIQLTEKNGLAGNVCRGILHEKGVVWVGTNKGLSRIETDAGNNYKITNYNATTGLLTNEVNSICKFNNQILLAHNNGITLFPKDNIYNSSSVPPVYIEQISINDSIYKGFEARELDHTQNHITINYVGISFKDVGNIQYRYKISGLDTNWIYTNYTSVKYQGLQPGTYLFSVYAKNNAGAWSKNPATFSFKILPAWWQTWTFKILAFLFLISATALAIKRYYTNIRKREEEKFNLHQRIAQTELQALRAQMNPHFVFNAINSVQYFITHNDPDSSQKYLSKFARLIRYVVDNSKPANIPLKTEIDALTLYLELEALRFSNKFVYEIIIEPGVNVNYIQIPSMLIQPYVENSIWHGLMHKKGNGKIEIRFSIHQNTLHCTIKDDGIGRLKSAQLKEANPNTLHKSLGMNITKDRLEIINQMNNSSLNLVIDDVLNSDNAVIGTVVKLNIPLN